MTIYFGNLICPSCDEICSGEDDNFRCPSIYPPDYEYHHQHDYSSSLGEMAAAGGSGSGSGNSKRSPHDDFLVHDHRTVKSRGDLSSKSTLNSYLNSQHEYCVGKMSGVSSASQLRLFDVFESFKANTVTQIFIVFKTLVITYCTLF